MLVLLIAIPALGILGQAPLFPPVVHNTTTVIWKTETVVTHVSVNGATAQLAASGATASKSTRAPAVRTPIAVHTDRTSVYLSSPTTKIVTEIESVTEPVSSSVATSQSSAPASASGRIWSAPLQMTDLSAFNISTFAGGHHNLNIVKGIPAHASATSVTAASTSTDRPISWDNSSSVLQLLYPAHSINPAKRPQGGAQFYASPLDIAESKNITLQYSVFFPVDFDWVLAGKLPGIYGGRSGCSGGDSALDCFSTRLMWRRGGAGELYLYAPKDKQSKALCSHPQSVCDTSYGFSIGRGSFRWAKGAWTTVQQSIVLNTPGRQNGSFILDVNGRRVIERNDIYYRGLPRRVPDPIYHKPKPIEGKKPDGGLLGLGPLLGGLGLLGLGEAAVYQDDLVPLSPVNIAAPEYQAQHEWAIEVGKGGRIVAVPVGSGSPVSAGTTTLPDTSEVVTQSPQPSSTIVGKPVGFIGLFFSTFFGGHDLKYATPRDQYVWFKDFAVSHNG